MGVTGRGARRQRVGRQPLPPRVALASSRPGSLVLCHHAGVGHHPISVDKHLLAWGWTSWASFLVSPSTAPVACAATLGPVARSELLKGQRTPEGG